MRSTVTITSSMTGPASLCAAQAGVALASAQPESTAATAAATDVDELMLLPPNECLCVRACSVAAAALAAASNTPAETTLSIFIER